MAKVKTEKVDKKEEKMTNKISDLQKLFEVDSTWAILVECSEDVLVEWSGLAFWKQRRVDREEFAATQFAARAVFLHIKTVNHLCSERSAYETEQLTVGRITPIFNQSIHPSIHPSIYPHPQICFPLPAPHQKI